LRKAGIRHIFPKKGAQPYKEGGNKAGKGRVTWHTGFSNAIRIELSAYGEGLGYEFEHPLSREPLRIDGIIRKKEGVGEMETSKARKASSKALLAAR
jgi:hypothetical protein